MAVCAAIPGWFRPKMKLDPQANDRVRSSWRLRKSIPSSFREERGPSYDTCANEVLGSVKMRFWVESRTGAVAVVSRWLVGIAFALPPQSGLAWLCFLFPLIEPEKHYRVCLEVRELLLTLTSGLTSVVKGDRKLRLVKAPQELHGFRFLMAWHPRLHTDPRHVWLREAMRSATARLNG
jgi:hypothetical protein